MGAEIIEDDYETRRIYAKNTEMRYDILRQS